ncbi:phosphoribosyltransferase [Sphaerisporangium fuscum]|uniref:phosphoribosyltransferase n=1 Tax=Sphaerisporangium fuscum TaxID=2835868 RepID=UPI001BDBD67C|nr:phosphoribosyltransferase [Sphaerisporangium fuscum]
MCRGPANPGWSRCYTCEQHLRAAQSLVADVVVPISYAVKRQQHAHALAAYKAAYSPPEVQTDLLNLLLLFIVDHHPCVSRAAGVDQWSHAAVVPSTKGRPGEHPLRALIGDRLRLPWAELTANLKVSPDLRAFHEDRFSASPDGLAGAQVLLLDDTWTTGARVQSASYALKQAGATRVAAIVLGRHVNPEYDGWKPILQTIKDRPYRQETCAVHL